MIDVSLAILAGKKGESVDKQPKAARRFAIMALKQHSIIHMDNKHWEDWIASKKTIPIPPLGGWPKWDTSSSWDRGSEWDKSATWLGRPVRSIDCSNGKTVESFKAYIAECFESTDNCKEKSPEE